MGDGAGCERSTNQPRSLFSCDWHPPSGPSSPYAAHHELIDQVSCIW